MKKNIIKMALDIIMIVILALLYNSHVASMGFHEIAGLGILGLFITHCLFNVKWISAISKRFFSGSISLKVRLGYIVNLLLAITFIFVAISGIQTSQVLFPADNHGSVWRGIHHFFGAVSIILVGIHLGLHWSFVSNMAKKAIPLNKRVRKIVSITLLSVVIAFGFYSIATSSFGNWIVEPFVTQSKNPFEHTANNDVSTAEQTSKKSDDGKTGGEMPSKHDDSTKTVETSPAIVLGTIARFVSIMGVFSVLTYYIEKFFRYKKKAKQ